MDVDQMAIDKYRIEFNSFCTEIEEMSDIILLFEKLNEKIEHFKKVLKENEKDASPLLSTNINYYIGTLYNECASISEKYYETKKLKGMQLHDICDKDNLFHINASDYEIFYNKKIKLHLNANKYYKESYLLSLKNDTKNSKEWYLIKNHLQINMDINNAALCPLLTITKLDSNFNNQLDLYNDFHATLAYQYAVEEFNKVKNNGMDYEYIKLLDHNANIRFNKTLYKFVECFDAYNDENSQKEIENSYNNDFILSFEKITNKEIPEEVRSFKSMIQKLSTDNNILITKNIIHLNDTLRPIIDYLDSYNKDISIEFEQVINEFIFLTEEFYSDELYHYYGDFVLSATFNLFDKISYSLFKYMQRKNCTIGLDESKFDFNNFISKGIPILKKISEHNFRMLIRYSKIITLFNEQLFSYELEEIRTRRIDITHKPTSQKNSEMYAKQNTQIKLLFNYISIFILLSITAININEENSSELEGNP